MFFLVDNLVIFISLSSENHISDGEHGQGLCNEGLKLTINLNLF